ncbi:OmpA family protein [Cobetia amphilecti]|uniref:OmpA family protein n=1 Tax=Cobetia amphilecti TaxID=1055104 RepID=UPI001CDA87BB|nr:OmpA family protein [Cobetia amphilecti]UBU47630.1 OmpA family protein [Cobetia amphilecti]
MLALVLAGIGKEAIVSVSRLPVLLKMASGAVSVASLVIIAGCASSQNNYRTDIRDAGDGFPALDSNWHDGGIFVDPQRILRINQGQSKDQVRQLLGNPHFSEGFFGVREWNYVFNLYTPEKSGDYITCQYQVEFDEVMALEATRWRDTQCSALLVPLEQKEDQTLILSGDVLFDFDSDRLTLEGRRALAQVARSAISEFESPRMLVEGYTDHFGSAAYNEKLSQSRADNVAGYLSTHGISRGDIRAIGHGEAEPVVTCPGIVAEQSVTECLSPNRRVEITISGSVGG